MRELATFSSAEALAKMKIKEWTQKLSFGLYTNTMRRQMRELEAQNRVFKKDAHAYLVAAAAALGAGLAAAGFVSVRFLLFAGAAAAGLLLFWGSVLPMLRMTLHKSVAYLGDVIFSYEVKSLFGTIEKLFYAHDWVVGGAIVLFSVIVPWSKTLMMLAVAFFVRTQTAQRAMAFFKHLGKWSMLDVFVVATLLVFLSMKENGLSRASMGEGVYFFLGYVLLSMVLSLVAERVLHRDGSIYSR
jgi:hypothetical protein